MEIRWYKPRKLICAEEVVEGPLGSRRWKGAQEEWVCEGETDQWPLMGTRGTTRHSGYQRVWEGEMEQRERGFTKVKRSWGRWWEHEGRRDARVRRGLEKVKMSSWQRMDREKTPKMEMQMDPFENGPKRMPGCAQAQTPNSLFWSGNRVQKELKSPTKRTSQMDL